MHLGLKPPWKPYILLIQGRQSHRSTTEYTFVSSHEMSTLLRKARVCIAEPEAHGVRGFPSSLRLTKIPCIAIFKEFYVVFTVSSIVGNPVKYWLYKMEILKENDNYPNILIRQ